MEQNNKPGWGMTVGVYIFCLLTMAGTAGISSLMISQAIGQGGYGVGGLLSWLCSLICTSYYRSTRKVGTAVLIAVGFGVALGAFTAIAGPYFYSLRYGA